VGDREIGRAAEDRQQGAGRGQQAGERGGRVGQRGVCGLVRRGERGRLRVSHTSPTGVVTWNTRYPIYLLKPARFVLAGRREGKGGRAGAARGVPERRGGGEGMVESFSVRKSRGWGAQGGGCAEAQGIAAGAEFMTFGLCETTVGRGGNRRVEVEMCDKKRVTERT
jgi:hypothetical protein